MEFQNGSQDFHTLTSLSYCLHSSDGIFEQGSMRKELFAKAPGLQRSSTMVQKGRWQDHETRCFLNQKTEEVKCCGELDPYRNTSQTCPELHLLHDSKYSRAEFHGSPPYHPHFKWKLFPVTEDEKWMQCIIFSHYSFPSLQCFLLDFVYYNIENYLHPKRTKRVLSLNSNDTTFR